jgi:hypothetical protein
MCINGALKQLIALEEKKPDHGQLITLAYDTGKFFVPAPFEWQLGLLFVGVLNTNHERVSVFMYVGAVDDNRLCVTIDHAPILLSFTTVSLQQTICKFSKSNNSRANRELMYVPTLLITRQGMLPVIPLQEDQVATCFDKGGSFKSVRDLFHLYDKQTAPMEKTRNHLFKDWLRAALVSGNDDNLRSQLEISPQFRHSSHWISLLQITVTSGKLFPKATKTTHLGNWSQKESGSHSHQHLTQRDHQQRKMM